MELWIRSQDKEVLSKINNIKLVEYNGQFSIVGYCEREVDDFDLGIYMSKERAFEVLDEIQNLLQPKIIYTQKEPIETFELGVYKLKQDVDIKIQEVNRIVYEMPQD